MINEKEAILYRIASYYLSAVLTLIRLLFSLQR